MIIFQKLSHRFSTACELMSWMMADRIWMLPIIIGLFLLSIFVAFAQVTNIAPFIYTLF